MGLFSLIDAIMDQPLDHILDKLPLSEEVHRTLLGHPTPIQPVRSLMLACEQAEWETADCSAKEMGVAPEPFAKIYRDSLIWARTALA